MCKPYQKRLLGWIWRLCSQHWGWLSKCDENLRIYYPHTHEHSLWFSASYDLQLKKNRDWNPRTKKVKLLFRIYHINYLIKINSFSEYFLLRIDSFSEFNLPKLIKNLIIWIKFQHSNLYWKINFISYYFVLANNFFKEFNVPKIDRKPNNFNKFKNILK